MKTIYKQRLVFGNELLTDLKKLKVLLVNINWTTIEIARNLCLLDVGTINLLDKSVVTEHDLFMNFLFKPEHVGKTKSEIVKLWLHQISSSVTIDLIQTDATDIETNLKESDVIILTDVNSFTLLKRTEDQCIKHGKKFIYVSTNEQYAAAIFNFLYIESKIRFNHISNLDIESISYAKDGVIKFYENHPFQKADFITVEGLEETKGFMNEEIRPVLKVIDENSIQIEDTSMYTNIGTIMRGSAFVSGVNFPVTHRFKSVLSQLYAFLKEHQQYNINMKSDYMYILPFLKYQDAIKANTFASKEEAFAFVSQDENIREGCSTYKDFILARDLTSAKRLSPLENSLIAGLVSYEILKINGLYLPNKAPIYLQSLNLDFIFEKKLVIFGGGAKTHELLKILLIESQIRQTNYQVLIFDDNVVHSDKSRNYFFAQNHSIGQTKSSCLAKEINNLNGFLKIKEFDRTQSYKTVANSDIVIITLDNYLSVYEFADLVTCIKKPLYVVTEHLGKYFSSFITESSLPSLEKYYVNTTDNKKVNVKGLDIPEVSSDVAKWTGLLFEFVFEHFIIEGDLFKNNTKGLPFYHLVIFLKAQFYEFLLNQSPKESNIISEGIVLFKIIFNWYIEVLLIGTEGDRMRKFEEIKPIDFDLENPLHQEFIVAFVGMFKGIFVPNSPKIDDKIILDTLMIVGKDVNQKFPDFSYKQIDENYKINLRKIIKSEKYFKEYKIRHELVEFDRVRAFANVLYQLKMNIFGLKSKNISEFDYYFFNEQWSLPTDSAILAGLVFNHIGLENKPNFPKVMSIDPSNCKSSFY